MSDGNDLVYQFKPVNIHEVIVESYQYLKVFWLEFVITYSLLNFKYFSWLFKIINIWGKKTVMIIFY